MRELFEREVRAAVAYIQAALEPGVRQGEALILLGLAKRRLTDASKAAQFAEPPAESKS